VCGVRQYLTSAFAFFSLGLLEFSEMAVGRTAETVTDVSFAIKRLLLTLSLLAVFDLCSGSRESDFGCLSTVFQLYR